MNRDLATEQLGRHAKGKCPIRTAWVLQSSWGLAPLSLAIVSVVAEVVRKQTR